MRGRRLGRRGRRQIGGARGRGCRRLALELPNLTPRRGRVGSTRQRVEVLLVGRDRLGRLTLVAIGLAEPEQGGTEPGRDGQRPPERVDGGERLLLVEQNIGR